jgi:hypothetical protein
MTRRPQSACTVQLTCALEEVTLGSLYYLAITIGEESSFVTWLGNIITRHIVLRFSGPKAGEVTRGRENRPREPIATATHNSIK